MDFRIFGIIFLINVAYVTLFTIRNILSMRGYRNIAPVVGFVEISINTVGLSIVMQYINENIIYLIAYAFGFSVGNYLGMIIIDKMALGYTLVYIITNESNRELIDILRKIGYGVTVQSGAGKDSNKLILNILTPKSEERTLYNTIDEIAPTAFYYASEASYIHGGYLSKKIKKDNIQERTDIALEKYEESQSDN